MESNLRKALNMALHPVAVLRLPVLSPVYAAARQHRSGCVIAGLEAAARGETLVFLEADSGCLSGKIGLGFPPAMPNASFCFLAKGNGTFPGLRYKKDAALADAYGKSLPQVSPASCLVLKPLEELAQGETPVSVIFLVNPDQLSGLVTLANYDQPTQDSVKIRFGAGCVQSILYAVADSEADRDWCTVGITDPSGRLHLSKDLLSFAMPYRRFLAMEANASESFFSGPVWQAIQNRI